VPDTRQMTLDGTDLLRALAELDASARAAILAAASQHRDATLLTDARTARVWAAFAALAAPAPSRAAAPAGVIDLAVLADDRALADAESRREPVPVGSGAVYRRRRTRDVDEDVDYGGEGG